MVAVPPTIEMAHHTDNVAKGVGEVRLQRPERPSIRNRHSIEKNNYTYYPYCASRICFL
jgi:hypothetical protein